MSYVQQQRFLLAQSSMSVDVLSVTSLCACSATSFWLEIMHLFYVKRERLAQRTATGSGKQGSEKSTD